MPFPLRSTFLFLALLLIAGCAAPSYRVRVDAINDLAAMPALKTYVLASGTKDLDPASLRFREAASLIRAALLRHGYTEAPRPADAALRITLTYGIGPAETRTVTHSTPVYAELGGGHVQSVTKTTGPDGKTSTTTKTTVVPGRYERVGNDITTHNYTLYPKHITLSATESADLSNQTRELWNVSASLQNESADLRANLPVLIAAIEPYLGENTGHAITVKIVEHDGHLVIEPPR
jgi:hypothetical protein